MNQNARWQAGAESDIPYARGVNQTRNRGIKISNCILFILIAMDINHIIVHGITKEQHMAHPRVHLSPRVLDINEEVEALMVRLHAMFTKNRSNYAYARFLAEHSFPSDFQTYHTDRSDDTFIQLTHDAINRLADIISGLNTPGGYLVFASYTEMGRNLFSVFLVRHSKAFRFNEEDDNIEIIPGEQIDTDSLAVACEINLGKYVLQEQQERYLRFTAHRRSVSETSKYFYTWLGVDTEGKTDSRGYTEQLLQIVKTIPPPANEDGSPMEPDVFKRGVVQHIRTNQNKVNLYELGACFYPDAPNTFVEYSQNNDIVIDSEFKADTRTLNKFHKVSAEADNIRIGFEMRDMDEGKILVEDERIIIHSPRLVANIRSQTSSE